MHFLYAGDHLCSFHDVLHSKNNQKTTNESLSKPVILNQGGVIVSTMGLMTKTRCRDDVEV